MYSLILASMQEYNLTESQRLEAAIEKMALGDKTALEELYVSTKTAVYAFILSMLKDRHSADDVFQDVYVSIFENAAGYEAQGKPLAWIFTIAKNKCRMHFRSEKNHVDMDSVQELWTVDAPAEDRLVLQAAFGKLADEERNIVFLHVLSGMKHREIAKLLDMPLPTVLSNYHRALKKLRVLLEE